MNKCSLKSLKILQYQKKNNLLRKNINNRKNSNKINKKITSFNNIYKCSLKILMKKIGKKHFQRSTLKILKLKKLKKFKKDYI